MEITVDVPRMRAWEERMALEAARYDVDTFSLENLKPGFIAGSVFFHTLTEFYTLFLAGGLGKGKTLLAFAIAHWLVWHGYVVRVISNIKSPLCEDIAAPVVDAAVVYDESWISLNSRHWATSEASTFGAFLRKLNTYMLFPSRIPVDKQLREFWCQRVFCGDFLGLPLWIYEWRMECGISRERGRFALWRPARYFGLYDTLSRPRGDGGLSDALRVTSPVLNEFGDMQKSGDEFGMSDVAIQDRMIQAMMDAGKKKGRFR